MWPTARTEPSHLVGAIALAAMLAAPSAAVSASPPPLQSVPFEQTRAILDLAPLELTRAPEPRAIGGAWTRREMRSYLWSHRDALARCMRAYDRAHPISDGALTITLDLNHEGASAHHASADKHEGCFTEVLRSLPTRALEHPTRYTITLYLPELDRPITRIHTSHDRLQISGATPGIIPIFEALEDPLPAPSAVGRSHPSSDPAPRRAAEIARVRESLAPCTRAAQKRNPDLEGVASVTLSHDAKGRIDRTWWDGNTTGDPRLLACMDRVLLSQRLSIATRGFTSFAVRVRPPAVAKASAPKLGFGVGPTFAGHLDGSEHIDTLRRHITASRERLAACHKRYSPARAAGSFAIRLRADTYHERISHVAILERERPNVALEGCIIHALEERSPRITHPRERVLITIDWRLDYLATGRGEGVLDKAMEARILATSEPPSPRALLGPARIMEEDYLERAARVYEANGFPEHAADLWLTLARIAGDPVARPRHLERALQVSARGATPRFHRALLLELSRSSDVVGSGASASIGQQAEATITRHLVTAAKHAHQEGRMLEDREMLQAASALYEVSLERSRGPESHALYYYVGECAIDLQEDARAIDAMRAYRRLAPAGEYVEESLRATCRHRRASPRSKPPTACFGEYLRRSDAISRQEDVSARVRAEMLGWAIEFLQEIGYTKLASTRHKRLLEEFDPLDIPAALSP